MVDGGGDGRVLATPAWTRRRRGDDGHRGAGGTADRIFVGTVLSVASRPKAATPKYFETVVRWYVEETVAGTLEQTSRATFSGGEVGGIRQRVDGMPEIKVGERYVVMLAADQDPPLVSPFVGFNQGLYRVVGVSRGRDASSTIGTADRSPQRRCRRRARPAAIRRSTTSSPRSARPRAK